MKKILIFFLLLLFLLINVQVGNAESKKEENPILITPVIPKNQEEGIVHYYSLKYSGKEKEQTIYLKVENNQEKDAVIRLYPANALTSLNGDIEYVTEEETYYENYLDEDFAMSSRIHLDEKVVVPKKSTVEIPIRLEVPVKKGEYLGGILIQTDDVKKQSEEVNSNQNVSISMNHRVLYAVAIKWDVGEVQKKKGMVEVEGVNVLNRANRFEVELHMGNNQKYIMEDVKGTYEITNNKKEELFEGEFGGFKMAPMTKIGYPILWDGEILKTGTYNMTIKMENGKIYEQKFKISNDDVKKYQKKNNISQPITETAPIWMWVILSGMFFLMLFMLFILLKKKKGDREEENR